MTVWRIETTLAREETDRFLRSHEPWRIGIEFSNGSRAADFKTVQPFAANPLGKFAMLAAVIPKDALSGRVLDIGFNCGYNSIETARRYDARVLGIDINPRHKAVADWIASAANQSNIEFRIESGEAFVSPNEFTAILHLGTLYHLRNPLLSIENCAKSLRTNGWLALETTAYVGPGCDDALSKWIYGFKGDTTNYWALSKPTIEEFLGIAGLADVRLIKEARPAYVGDGLSRVLYIARKA